MAITEYNDFTPYCDKGLCLRKTIFNEKTCARDTKRLRCFGKYLNKNVPQEIEKDEQWEIVRYEVLNRDDYSCRLLKVLTLVEATNLPEVFKTLDVAHVIRRSQSKKLYYDPRNLVSLSRTFHQRLDQYKNPITGKATIREEVDRWWIRIVGLDTWNYLQENK